jgi:hypothetical protein
MPDARFILDVASPAEGEAARSVTFDALAALGNVPRIYALLRCRISAHALT